jgi:hypothetical protein
MSRQGLVLPRTHYLRTVSLYLTLRHKRHRLGSPLEVIPRRSHSRTHITAPLQEMPSRSERTDIDLLQLVSTAITRSIQATRRWRNSMRRLQV